LDTTINARNVPHVIYTQLQVAEGTLFFEIEDQPGPARPATCRELATDLERAQYMSRCHRDAGHDGDHRSFLVGASESVFWS